VTRSPAARAARRARLGVQDTAAVVRAAAAVATAAALAGVPTVAAAAVGAADPVVVAEAVAEATIAAVIRLDLQLHGGFTGKGR